MKVKRNLLFSNQSFADEVETQPVVINLDLVVSIGGCHITNGLNQGPKTKVVLNNDDVIIIDENIEDVAMELWNNYDRDY